MYEKLVELMKVQSIEFKDLAERLGISTKTLNRKCHGLTEWTYKEITLLTEILKIEDPGSFFF